MPSNGEDPPPTPTPKAPLGGGFGAKAEKASGKQSEPISISNNNIHEYSAQGKIGIGGGSVSAWLPPEGSGGAKSAGGAGSNQFSGQLRSLLNANYQRRRQCRELSRKLNLYDPIVAYSKAEVTEEWLSAITAAYASLKPVRDRYFEVGMRALSAGAGGSPGDVASGSAKRDYWRNRHDLIKEEVSFFETELSVGASLLAKARQPRGFAHPPGSGSMVTKTWPGSPTGEIGTAYRRRIASQRIDAAKRHLSAAKADLKSVYRLAQADGGIPGRVR